MEKSSNKSKGNGNSKGMVIFVNGDFYCAHCHIKSGSRADGIIEPVVKEVSFGVSELMCLDCGRSWQLTQS